MGHAQLLVRRTRRQVNADAHGLHAAQVILDQTMRLNRLINELLDVARLQTGQIMLHRTSFDVSKLARRMVSEIQPSLEHHSVEYAGDEDPLVILGDELRIEQVLQNLLQNAIKYSPEGGPITLSVGRETEWAVLAVRDRGIGIPTAGKARLFERYYRANNVGRYRITGLGVGLYVVQEVVTAHEGMIEVESIEGQGSTFTVRLPLAPVQEPQ